MSEAFEQNFSTENSMASMSPYLVSSVSYEALNSDPVFGLEFMSRHTKYSAYRLYSMFNSPTKLASTRSFVQHISCCSLTTIQPSFYSYIQMDYNMPSRFPNFLSSATPSYRVKAYSALLVLLSIVRLLNHHHPFLRPSMNIFIGYAWTNVVVVDVGIYFMSGDVHTSMANGVCM